MSFGQIAQFSFAVILCFAAITASAQRVTVNGWVEKDGKIENGSFTGDSSFTYSQTTDTLTAQSITLTAPATTGGMAVVVDGEFDGRCPVCKREGKTSQVEPGHRTSTLAMPYSYYDEKGVLHSGRDTNTTTSHYRCSNGHSFTTVTKRGEREWIVAARQPSSYAGFVEFADNGTVFVRTDPTPRKRKHRRYRRTQ